MLPELNIEPESRNSAPSQSHVTNTGKRQVCTSYPIVIVGGQLEHSYPLFGPALGSASNWVYMAE